jgi:histone-lysine N-methyltransferase SETMAR
VEILKRLREPESSKEPELWSNDWILHHDNAPAHKAQSFKQFLTQKSIAETEHPPYSPDLAPNDFWLFPKV